MRNWSWQRIGRLNKRDILDAFRIVAYEIRAKCKRFASEGLTQADACGLALRIRDHDGRIAPRKFATLKWILPD